MTFMAMTPGIAVAAGADPRDIVGLNNRFGVTIDDMNLGMWGQCEGLSVDFKPEKVNGGQGGVYDYEVYLPGQMTYPAVTLRRAINAADSARVQGWLAKKIQEWVYAAGTGKGSTGVITLYDSKAAAVISWSLHNVYPSKWDGPKLDAASGGIAMESLSLVHEGFL